MDLLQMNTNINMMKNLTLTKYTGDVSALSAKYPTYVPYKNRIDLVYLIEFGSHTCIYSVLHDEFFMEDITITPNDNIKSYVKRLIWLDGEMVVLDKEQYSIIMAYRSHPIYQYYHQYANIPEYVRIFGPRSELKLNLECYLLIAYFCGLINRKFYHELHDIPNEGQFVPFLALTKDNARDILSWYSDNYSVLFQAIALGYISFEEVMDENLLDSNNWKILKLYKYRAITLDQVSKYCDEEFAEICSSLTRFPGC